MVSKYTSSAAWSLAKTAGLVTLITVLIWLWAEAEGLRTVTVTARVQFVEPADDVAVRVVSPDWRWDAVAVRLEGPAVAIDDAERLLRAPVDLLPGVGAVPAEPGQHQVRLVEALRAHADLKRLGVAVTDVNPPTVTIQVSRLVARDLPVRVELRGIETEGEPTVRPSTVRVVAPEEVWRPGDQTAVGGGPTAAAATAVATALIHDDERRMQAEDGPQTIQVRVTVPDVLRQAGPIRVEPEIVRVTLRVRRQTEEYIATSVPVWITMPHTEGANWDVEVLDGLVRNVTVRGPTDLIKQVRSRELVPIAFVMLSSDDLEEAVARPGDEGVISKQAVFAPVWATLIDPGAPRDPAAMQMDSATQEEVAPLRFSAENRRVNLRITRRSSTTAPAGSSTPAGVP